MSLPVFALFLSASILVGFFLPAVELGLGYSLSIFDLAQLSSQFGSSNAMLILAVPLFAAAAILVLLLRARAWPYAAIVAGGYPLALLLAGSIIQPWSSYDRGFDLGALGPVPLFGFVAAAALMVVGLLALMQERRTTAPPLR